MAKVLVTGAAGFIGSHLCEALVRRGDSVVGYDSFDDFYDPAIKRRNVQALVGHGKFSLVEGDIRDSHAVRAALGDGVAALAHSSNELASESTLWKEPSYNFTFKFSSG